MKEPMPRDPRLAELIVKATDGLLSSEEEAQLLDWSQQDPSIAEDIDDARKARNIFAGIGLRNPNPDDFEKFETSLAGRGERTLGWTLLFGGVAGLIVCGLASFFRDPQVAWSIKGLVACVALGVMTLLFHVGRRFVAERKKDSYKNIVR